MIIVNSKFFPIDNLNINGLNGLNFPNKSGHGVAEWIKIKKYSILFYEYGNQKKAGYIYIKQNRH